MTDEKYDRLAQTLRLLAREAEHLAGVRERLSGRQAIDRKRVEALSGEPAGIDLLESFAAKFSRMQDNLVDKLLPRLLIAAGERPRAAIDNLNRAERLGWIQDAAAWIGMRTLRNRLVHEYVEDPGELAQNLEIARIFTDELLAAHERMAEYAWNLF